MNVISSHWNVVAAVLVAVVWIAKNFGPSAIAAVRSALAKLLPEVQQRTSILSGVPLLLIALLLAPHFLPSPAAVVPVQPAKELDMIDECGIAGRALLADEVEKFVPSQFESDQAREDAINQKIRDVIEASFVPLNEEIAKAIRANRMSDCAGRIRDGKLR
jgi:hypothetical protein